MVWYIAFAYLAIGYALLGIFAYWIKKHDDRITEQERRIRERVYREVQNVNHANPRVGCDLDARDECYFSRDCEGQGQAMCD